MKNIFTKKKGGALVAALLFSLLGAQGVEAFITSQLDVGDRGGEVTELQAYLKTDASLYPSGLVTGYYGQLTKAGVERFQTREGIVSSGTPETTGYGRVGPRTRAALNLKMTGGGDVSAPVITSVLATPTSTGASISWSLSEASRTKVYYSTSPIQIRNIYDITGVSSGEPTVSGTLAAYDTVARAAHSVSINGLAPNTTYYYVVVALDANNNVGITLPAYFTTN